MRSFLCVMLFLLCTGQLSGQACPPLQAPAPEPGKLLFTPAQEMELGEVIRQQLESEFLVIDEERVTGYLKRVGERVASQLPETGLRYEFSLYDQPEVQAFGMPGGRVYVSRKLVAFLKSEDELAGLLGHELGHLAARQQALAMSRAFREVLGVKSISENEDLFERYNDFVERGRLRKTRSEGNEEKGQEIADRLGVQAVARAGYSPQALPDLLDRLMQTKGVTGNWLTDLLGATRPDARRLRLALKDISSVADACSGTKAPANEEEFRKWQSAVLHYQGIGHGEHLPGVVARGPLNNPLRSDIEHFRFSPDGRYLLAQDESGIYVLRREPFSYVFRIDAVNAQAAQFSPDSRQIVFFDPGLRVEVWDVERQEQTSVADVPALHGCRQAAVSPDARYVACFTNDVSLMLYEVTSGETVLQMDNFFELEPGPYGVIAYLYLMTHENATTLQFSPDGRYLAASARARQEVVFDLTTRKKVSIPGELHAAMGYAFTFVGPDRMVGIDRFKPDKSPLVEFPSGRLVDRMPLGGESLVAATNPKYILVRPVKDHPIGVYGLGQKRMLWGNRTPAADVWGEVTVSERMNGEIGLYPVGETKPTSVMTLPLGKLGVLRSFTASANLRFLAMSSRTRGGVWDLAKDEREILLRGFQRASYAPDSAFLVDFPEFEKADREIVDFSPTSKQVLEHRLTKDDDVTFFGDVFVRTKHNDKNRFADRNVELEALDTATEKPLWSRGFPKQGPWLDGSPGGGKIVLSWNAKADGVRDEVARNPKLQERWAKENPGDSDYLIEVLNARDGTTAGGIILRTGKFSYMAEHLDATGDWLAVADNRHRVLLYSIATGEQKAKLFGYRPQIAPNGERLGLANGRGYLAIYDLGSLKQISQLSFANPVSGEFFSADGRRLLVLTSDQTAFIIDVEEGSGGTSTTGH